MTGSAYSPAAVSEKVEKDPTGRDPKQGGAKLDLGKSPIQQGVFEYFPRALKAVGDVSGFGASKYSWGGWGSVPDGINRYGNALGRHILAESIEGEYDKESGMLHAAQVAWNALARLEYILRAKEGK